MSWATKQPTTTAASVFLRNSVTPPISASSGRSRRAPHRLRGIDIDPNVGRPRCSRPPPRPRRRRQRPTGQRSSNSSAASAGPANVARPSSVPAVTFIATSSDGVLATSGPNASWADRYGVAATLLTATSTYTATAGASVANPIAISCLTDRDRDEHDRDHTAAREPVGGPRPERQRNRAGKQPGETEDAHRRGAAVIERPHRQRHGRHCVDEEERSPTELQPAQVGLASSRRRLRVKRRPTALIDPGNRSWDIGGLTPSRS